MNTTVHPVAPEEVMAFLDGELSATDAQTVWVHMDGCADCAKLAEQFRSTSLSLSGWNVETVPTKLEESVTASLAKTRSGLRIGKANVFVRASFWTWKQWAIGSGGAVAALFLVLAISLPMNRSRQAAYYYEKQTTDRDSLGTGSVGKLQAETSKGTAPPNSPGVVAGLIHGLGDHAQNSLVVDGQPVTDQQSKVFNSTTLAPMIARTVSLSIVVKDFAAARSSLDVILARHHGYSAQLGVSTPENAPRGLQASLRIPAPELSSAVADLRTLGRVENESQSGEEVTAQHMDLVARLKNSRETEQRLRTILQQRPGKVGEVLQVEQEIARVRGDIEGMEAEQKALEHRVDFATIELQLAEEYKAQLSPPAASVSTRIHNAFVAGYRSTSETLLGIVLFFAEDGLTLLIWLLIVMLPGTFVWRRYRKALSTV